MGRIEGTYRLFAPDLKDLAQQDFKSGPLC